MKQIKLNTLFCVCISALIIIAFLVLYSVVMPNLNSLKNYTTNKEEKQIHNFIKEVFVADLDKQASYLNSLLERVASFAENIAEKVHKIVDNKASSRNYQINLEYDNKNDVFCYIDWSSLIKADYEWGYMSIWKPDSKSKEAGVPAEIQTKLNNLSMLEPALEAICLNPNSIIGIYVDFINYGICYTRNVTKVIDSFYKVCKYYENYVKSIYEPGKPHWSNAFLSMFSDELLLLYRYPVEVNNKEDSFEVGIEFSYSIIEKRLDEFISKEQYTEFDIIRIIFDNKGNIIYLPESKYDLFSLPKNNMVSIADVNNALNYRSSSDKKVIALFDEIFNTANGMVEKQIKDSKYLISFRNMPYNDWDIVVIAETKNLYRKVEAAKIEYNSIFKKIYIYLAIDFLIILIVALLVTIMILNRYFVKPIENLKTKFKLLGKGIFDIRITKKTSIREMNELADDFNTLSNQLGEYTEKMKIEEAAKQVIKAEMNFAWKLQESVLPKITKQFKKEEFELYAKLIPATSMSGDFYDFYFLDKETLALVLADVSGKGLPAAFYMSMSKAIIKETCLKSNSLNPAETLKNVNRSLCEDNANCMFLTVYLIFYNIKSGRLIFSNAGHHEYITSDSAGIVQIGGVTKSPAIGLLEDFEYKNTEIILKNNEIFAVYTDGITEAPNKNNQQFGTDRVIRVFEQNHKETVKNTGDNLIKQVLDFQSGKKFDDITLLMIKRTL